MLETFACVCGHVVLIMLCAVLGARAQDRTCTVARGPGWTSYRVPGVNATNCEYSWANGSHVVANHASQLNSLVLDQSMNLLTTRNCFEQVQYRRDCISEGISYQVTCTAVCSTSAGVRDTETETRWHVFAFVPVITVLGAVLAIWGAKRRRSNTRPDVESQNT